MVLSILLNFVCMNAVRLFYPYVRINCVLGPSWNISHNTLVTLSVHFHCSTAILCRVRLWTSAYSRRERWRQHDGWHDLGTTVPILLQLEPISVWNNRSRATAPSIRLNPDLNQWNKPWIMQCTDLSLWVNPRIDLDHLNKLWIHTHAVVQFERNKYMNLWILRVTINIHSISLQCITRNLDKDCGIDTL